MWLWGTRSFSPQSMLVSRWPEEIQIFLFNIYRTLTTKIFRCSMWLTIMSCWTCQGAKKSMWWTVKPAGRSLFSWSTRRMRRTSWKAGMWWDCSMLSKRSFWRWTSTRRSRVSFSDSLQEHRQQQQCLPRPFGRWRWFSTSPAGAGQAIGIPSSDSNTWVQGIILLQRWMKTQLQITCETSLGVSSLHSC